MSSVVEICNLALSNLGATNIISSITEASAEARYCRQFYGQSLRALLQHYPWTFAKTTAPLAPTSNAKSGKWGYCYVKPADCLKIRRILDPKLDDYVPTEAGGALGLHRYELEGNLIYTNIEAASIEYTREEIDPTKFSPLFIDALSWGLAVRLAMPVTRDPKVRADAYQLALRMRDEAAAHDANESRDTADIRAEMFEARK